MYVTCAGIPAKAGRHACEWIDRGMSVQGQCPMAIEFSERQTHHGRLQMRYALPNGWPKGDRERLVNCSTTAAERIGSNSRRSDECVPSKERRIP